jgi:hypothetical protein
VDLRLAGPCADSNRRLTTLSSLLRATPKSQMQIVVELAATTTRLGARKGRHLPESADQAVTNRGRPISSFPDIDAQDFAFVVVNARINSRSQNAAVTKRIPVCRRGVKIIHLKLFSVHGDDVSFGMPCHRLFM